MPQNYNIFRNAQNKILQTISRPAADVNGSGNVDVDDLNAVINTMLRK